MASEDDGGFADDGDDQDGAEPATAESVAADILMFRHEIAAEDYAAAIARVGDLIDDLEELERDAEVAPLLEELIAHEAERVFPKTSAEFADVLKFHARYLYKDYDPERALPELGRALAILEAHHPTDHRRIATTASLLGLIANDLGDLDQALAMTERALSIETAVEPPDTDAEVTLHLNLAMIRLERAECAAAHAATDRAAAILEKNGDRRTVAYADCLKQRAVIFYEEGGFAAALKTSEEALRTLEAAAPDDDRRRSMLKKIRALTHFDLENWAGAVRDGTESILLDERAALSDPLALADDHELVCHAAREAGLPEKALEHARAALEYAMVGQAPLFHVAENRRELGSILFQLDRNAEARPHLEDVILALRGLGEIGVDELAHALFELGALEAEEGRRDAAVAAWSEALELLAPRVDAEDPRLAMLRASRDDLAADDGEMNPQ